MAPSLTVTPVTGSIGAVVAGVDLHDPLDDASASGVRDALHEHSVLFFHDQELTEDEQLALLRAHPELTGKAAIAPDLTPDSSREQQGAGLDRCTPRQFAALSELNVRYRARFGFPFIVAVKGLDVDAILADLATRLEATRDAETIEARRQIARIARFRLDATFAAGR